ncbi:helix-turn-helix transcriptional regulator [Dyadobacter sp. CY261]|uniref:winged helix-turn-helix transcriptional regulator n=1 Tax=Dyadobacter sp. CY261 TaxID=2907203 RepID=UPI001F2407E7|nr:helix-turn-helix domain-containing protein [Dyadobacter sp. CY261]MCF0070954.1 helix-turn-helix transcriptional regulator [Dyadobacter sp. CY261]
MKENFKDNHPECREMILPVRDALDVISGKWKISILIAMSLGHKRFMELQNSIPNITPRMLSKELKELEMNLLVERKVYDSFPSIIEYERTNHARTLEPLIEELRRWGEYHRLVVTGTNIDYPVKELQD